MSLVGPRPLTAREYGKLDDVQSQRYAIKPGITGLWQVAHRGGPVYDESAHIALMARLDLVYCRRWSPLLDFTILLRTPGAVFRPSEREAEDPHATEDVPARRQDSSTMPTHLDADSRPAL
jgi:lipopolysaccharide/colanic/teichoic acid biosynthesis glycosyltransferase